MASKFPVNSQFFHKTNNQLSDPPQFLVAFFFCGRAVRGIPSSVHPGGGAAPAKSAVAYA